MTIEKSLSQLMKLLMQLILRSEEKTIKSLLGMNFVSNAKEQQPG